MPTVPEIDVLELARRELALTVSDLWLRYFALGGMSTAMEVEAILYGALVAADRDRDLIAVALNERYASWAATTPSPTPTTSRSGGPSVVNPPLGDVGAAPGTRSAVAEVDGNRTRRTGVARPTRFEGRGCHQAS